MVAAQHDDIDRRLADLGDHLNALGSVVVAFSGGVDSALLAAVAHRTLGPERAHAVTAVSPSLAGAEAAECRALADEWGMSWSSVETFEMERAAYRRNDADRCFHCKAELMDVVAPIAAAHEATIALGVNLDDLGDHAADLPLGAGAVAQRLARCHPPTAPWWRPGKGGGRDVPDHLFYPGPGPASAGASL